MNKYLLNKEEKKIFLKLKLKSKLDKSYMVTVRAYINSKGIDERFYTDDDIIYALVKGRLDLKCSK